ncbi:MAG TPA: hypothetical protein VE110_06590 [Gemmatimonadaceae bacterium]|nr:hypothetical protein [Gemmatimonadaceae bacterium]
MKIRPGRNMTVIRRSSSAIAIGLLISSSSRASAQTLPPIRQLGPVTAVGKDSFRAVTTVRQLPGGRLLVNDILGRRVVMLDSSLSIVSVVADTTSATANAYGTRPGGLIAYRGDSSLFIDPASLSMLLIDPSGKIGRVMSAPRANDVGFLVGGPFGSPGFDAQGRLVYRAPPRFVFTGPPPSAGQLPQFPTPPDSAALVRFDLATRKLDTVTWFKTPKVNITINRSPEGEVRVSSVVNPLPQGDDWAILPDGSIAIVRGRDYHVDFVGPQGVTSAPKIPFEWERLTDSAKVAFIDSAKVALEKMRASGQLNFGGFGPVTTRTVVDSGPGRAGSRGAGARDSASATATRDSAAGRANTPFPSLSLVQPSDLPDYKPAFVPGSTRADPDGNLWIRTTQNVDGRPVYNVINSKGQLVDRVQLPQNRALIGFGSGGVVYLGVRDGTTAHLEKARVK